MSHTNISNTAAPRRMFVGLENKKKKQNHTLWIPTELPHDWLQCALVTCCKYCTGGIKMEWHTAERQAEYSAATINCFASECVCVRGQGGDECVCGGWHVCFVPICLHVCVSVHVNAHVRNLIYELTGHVSRPTVHDFVPCICICMCVCVRACVCAGDIHVYLELKPGGGVWVWVTTYRWFSTCGH